MSTVHRVVRTLKRMVSWSRNTEDESQLTGGGASTTPAVAPAAPAPFKSTKRKFDSDDEDELDMSYKKSRPDATPQDADEGASVPPTPALEIPAPDLDGPAVDPVEPETKGTEDSGAAETSSPAAPAPTDAKTDAEDDSPTAAPDTPEADAKAEVPFTFPKLDEEGPNVFLTWKDGLFVAFEGGDSDEPVFWLKSQVLAAYPATDVEEVERDETVGYWSFELDDDALETPLAAALVSAFQKARVDGPGKDAWWWEVTVQRSLPEDNHTTPRIKTHIQSSQHCEDHDVSGGHKLGDWWIVDIKPASADAAKAIQTHRETY